MKSNETVIVPKNSKDLAGIRGFLEGIRSQFASAATVYEGPLRQLFDTVVASLDGAVTALPKVTEASTFAFTDTQFEQLCSLVIGANNIVATLGLELNQTKQQMAGMVVLEDAITKGLAMKPVNVEELLTQRIAERTGEKGDLTTKELSQQLCSAAKALGITEGRAARDAEITAATAAAAKADERKTAITTAGLPLPEAVVDAVLKASDADFAAAQATAAGRLKKLTEAGLDLPAELLGKIWSPESDYNIFQSTVLAIPALKRAASQDEPLAAALPGAAGNGKNLKMVV